jgi:spore coat polysaccharide biosynthesis predicted glycosyltransferase SpsG
MPASPHPSGAPRLLVRCDADARLGLGHAGRSLALAEELGSRMGARPLVVGHDDPLLRDHIGDRAAFVALAGAGYAADEVVSLLAPGDVLVSDHPGLDEAARRAVAATGARHVVVDDFGGEGEWPCAVVVNPNLGSASVPYPGAATVLAGPRFALLRDAVRRAAAAGRDPLAPVRRILVSLGGSDLDGRARMLLETLAPRGDAVEVVATLPAERLPDGVASAARSDLPDLLAWADMAVLSGGVLKYEAAACGLPALLVAVVEHQVDAARRLAVTGAARYLGRLDRLSAFALGTAVARLRRDADSRRRMLTAGRRLVDGRGVQRIADAVLPGR